MRILLLMGNGLHRAIMEGMLEALKHEFRSCNDMLEVRMTVGSKGYDLAIVDTAFGSSMTFEIASLIPDSIPMLIIAPNGTELPKNHAYLSRSGQTRIVSIDMDFKGIQQVIEDFSHTGEL